MNFRGPKPSREQLWLQTPAIFGSDCYSHKASEPAAVRMTRMSNSSRLKWKFASKSRLPRIIRISGALVKLMLDTKQPEKAEKDLRDAQANLTKQPDASFALAQFCEMTGRYHAVSKNDNVVNKWYQEAKSWYEKAHNAQPDNMLIARRMIEFFTQTKQTGEAESHLEAMIKQGRGAKPADMPANAPDITSWARRTLAALLASKGRKEDIEKSAGTG